MAIDYGSFEWPPTGGIGTAITSINLDTSASQFLLVGTSGTNFNISNNLSGNHTFNLPVASATNTGKLSSSDWSTFNSKQSALAFGDLTIPTNPNLSISGGAGAVVGSGTALALVGASLVEATSSVLTIAGASNAVLGSGVSIQVKQASASLSGYLSSTDWSTFNSKGSGTVTAVSVASANGLAGSSSGGAAPSLTLSTSITGILQGNGTAISAASTTGSGNVVLATAPTLSSPVVGTQTQGDGSTKAASTSYVDVAVANAVAGINPAVAVQAATTAASDTSGFTYNNGVSGIGATITGAVNTALTVDGFTFSALNQRLLVKNDTQSPSGAFNGVYYVTQVQTGILPLILTRALDYDAPSDINNTGAIPVINGTVNGTTSWVQTAQVVTVGTTPLTFAQFTKNPASYLLVANNLSDVASKTTSFNNLSPMTTGGDLIYGGASGTGTRLANGSSGNVLTSNGGTAAPSWQASSGAPRSYITYDSGNSHGGSVSGDTKIRNFVNQRQSVGSNITYTAQTTTAANFFTVNANGVYAVTYSDQNTGGGNVIGITINDAATSTNISTPLTYAQGLRATQAPSSTNTGTVSWTGFLSSGDIIRAHDDGGSNSSNSTCMITITQCSA